MTAISPFVVCSTTGYINLAFGFVRENSKYLSFEEKLGIGGLSRLLEEVARGRWWIPRDCYDGDAMASFLSTAMYSCTNTEHTDDVPKTLSFRNPTRFLRKYLRRPAITACRCSTERRHRASTGPPRNDWSIRRE